MNQAKIKSRINLITSGAKTYSTCGINENASSISIATKDGKFGIFSSNSFSTLIPYEFDNITRISSSIYILFKNGKMGLAHIQRDALDDISEFKVKCVIPCNYDYIFIPKDNINFVLLKQDNLTFSTIQIYFKKSQKLSRFFSEIAYVDNDYICVIDSEKDTTETLFNCYGLELLKKSIEGISSSIGYSYQMKSGTVFVEIKNDFSANLILIKSFKENAKIAVYTDDKDESKNTYFIKEVFCDEYIRPILSTTHMYTFEREAAVGFLCRINGEIYLLGDNLDLIIDNVYADCLIRTSILYSNNNCLNIQNSKASDNCLFLDI